MKNTSSNHYYNSIAEVSELIKKKELSPLELVKACLDRVNEFNPKLNAFITVMEAEGLENARIATDDINAGNWKGPLHGIPVAVKDFYDTAGIRTTAAFEYFKDRVPKEDSDVVLKLKAAGAILIGKTNMDSLGMGTTGLTGYFGAVHNPWNENYIAGGSSAGSAAAVAARLCFATVDTDAIGSCRLPAACCGVTGFKVSPDLINQKGILEGEKADEAILYLSQTGLITRSIEDTAIMLNALSDPKVSKSPFKDNYQLALNAESKLRVGIVTNFNATDEIRGSFFSAVEKIKTLGYAITEIEVPFSSASFNITNIEMDRNKINETVFKDIDVLLLPTTTGVTLSISKAGEMGSQALAADNTMFCNYFGLPSVSVPCGFDSNNLPIGLQIAGSMWGEGNVLKIAGEYQKASTWHLQYPGQ